jgi:predicted nucleic acid binding AN1-type Zn finger protein
MKCAKCSKRAVVNFTCKCTKVFCTACRLPEVHACTVTVVAPVVLPRVVAPKVQPI